MELKTTQRICFPGIMTFDGMVCLFVFNLGIKARAQDVAFKITPIQQLPTVRARKTCFLCGGGQACLK